MKHIKNRRSLYKRHLRWDMDRMDFQRARNDEQREQRRQLILGKAAEMLAQKPVAELSLNELSRQIGLAKSNVLRYFETREAILLELLSSELKGWGEALNALPVKAGATQRQRIDHLAKLVTDSLTNRPLLCDLASAQAAVLERNVSTEVVLSHKLAVRAVVERLADTFRRHLPELTRDDALQAISVALLMTAAAWPHSTPTQALLDAYDAEPGLAELHLSFADYVQGTLGTFLSGVLARKADADL